MGDAMPIQTDEGQTKSDRRGEALSLELIPSRSVFATGQRLSGVVLLRLERPVNIRHLSVSVEGRETASRRAVSGALRGSTLFFSREIRLIGAQRPRLTSERVARFWNAFLGRDTGRKLSAGEHIYPFSIPLPASLPPTYHGRAGEIEYTVYARLKPVGRRAVCTACRAALVSLPRAGRAQPVALSYPTAGGNVHTASVSADLRLPDRTVVLGGKIAGQLSVANPERTPISRVRVLLECCEWLQRGSRKEIYRRVVDQWVHEVGDPAPPHIEAGFELAAPRDAPPTVEGIAVAVIWLLKLRIECDPPIELKTPIAAYEPVCEPRPDRPEQG